MIAVGDEHEGICSDCKEHCISQHLQEILDERDDYYEGYKENVDDYDDYNELYEEKI